MKRVGTLSEIWRYPVKSMGGEPVNEAQIGPGGLAGDRHWAVIDQQTREIRGAKRWPELMHYAAQFIGHESPGIDDHDQQVQPIQITSPEHQRLISSDPDCDQRLSAWLKRELSLSRRRPANQRDHYRLAKARTEQSTAQEMGLLANEAPPDYSAMSQDVMATLADHATPPGLYVDAFPLHLLSTNTLQWLAERTGLNTDVRRFRPNLLVDIDTHETNDREDTWLGSTLLIGSVVLKIDSPTVRCAMPGRAQPLCGLDAQPELVRAMVEHSQRCLGVNVLVLQAGAVRVGDPIYLQS